jgi:integrase
VRVVPLLPAAVEITKRWLALLPSYAKNNPEGLLFPTPRGCRRQRSKNYGWEAVCTAAKNKRPVRWHDLRHTCGSSLIAGWWGRAWSIIEVRDRLGHSSVEVTELYAHLAPSALAQHRP